MRRIFNLIVLFFGTISIHAQQESQYTQYMYNTMSFNPAYTGSREVTDVFGLYRTQWVGLEGAPTTINFAASTPVGWHGNGLGLNVISDKIGPSSSIEARVNYAYNILGGSGISYAFGISAGLENLEIDFNKLNVENPESNLSGAMSQFSPNIGVGFYVHSDKWYVGLSAPKILSTKVFDDVATSVVTSKAHAYLMGGYVFDINPYLKFKPAAIVKGVIGAPLSLDISANFLINDKFTLGAGYRLDASVSAMAGFQVTNGIMMGYSYDFDTTNLGNYNSGSHEVFLRFDLFAKKGVVNPRFF